ncbi:MAG: hypothetical protein OXI96_04845 [Acidimicrobiaceae bacterium]|nr:hypothetical protein [Acidimicrobiaceae bacterium]
MSTVQSIPWIKILADVSRVVATTEAVAFVGYAVDIVQPPYDGSGDAPIVYKATGSKSMFGNRF